MKQSIYRFRLADPKQFLDREHALRHGKSDGEVIDLRQNFRSRGPLLEAVNAVFERLMTKAAAELDYDETQRLVPGRQFADAGGLPVFPGAPIELHLLPRNEESGAGSGSGAGDEAARESADPDDGDAGLDRTEREAALVAQRIRQIVGQAGAPAMHVYERDGNKPRPASFRDIVILLRSQKYKANQYVRILEGFGIPTHADSGSGFFDAIEIKDMVALLCLLDNQAQDLEMAAYLRSPLARLADAEDAMATVRVAYRDGDGRPTRPFHEAVVLYAAEHDDALAGRLRIILDRLADLRQRANRQPVHETIWAIYHLTGYVAYVSGLPGGEQRAANLMDLYDRARRFGTHRRQGLGRFLDYLKTLEAEADLGQPTIANAAQDVVRVMTVHASKGLEFPIVFVPDLGKKINVGDESGPVLSDRHLGLGLPVADEALFARYPSLAQVVVKDRIHRKLIAEELRVLYVALTRPMEHLILVGTAQANAAEGWRKRWAGQLGPLPESAVAGAQTVLDWLGPIWAAEEAAGRPTLRLEQHTLDELEDPRARRERGERSPLAAALCDRRPIEPSPATDPATQDVIARLEFAYPHAAATRQRAARGMTADGPGVARSPADLAGALALPRFMSPAAPLAPADAGTATHLVLQHLRFADAHDWADVERQLDRMVEDRKLQPDERKAVDVSAVEWFLSTGLAKLLREHEPQAVREMPVYVAGPPGGAELPDPVGPPADAGPPADGLDAVMVRGRVDVFVPLADGGVIVDYKTDRLPPAGPAADARVAAHVAQVRQYAAAVGRIVGRTVTRSCLVFLRARRIVEVDRPPG